jgi:hypothetical protein
VVLFKTVAEFLVRTEEKYEKSAKIIDAVSKIETVASKIETG